MPIAVVRKTRSGAPGGCRNCHVERAASTRFLLPGIIRLVPTSWLWSQAHASVRTRFTLPSVPGMGEVYRARDTKPGRDVVLKVVAENFTRDPSVRRDSTVRHR